jgi:hypothetical protein
MNEDVATEEITGIAIIKGRSPRSIDVGTLRSRDVSI